MIHNVTRSLPHAALLAAAISYPLPADAQGVVNCAQRSQVIEFLARQYAEKQAAVGLINPRAVMELYAADSGSWTLIVTDVSGRSCVIFAGQSWDAKVPVGPKA
ncbi:conserved hypothetical signal peptide protein [Sinorhizobium sojae CCBAU 05684]|uniref:Conserved hypothetical signal peptide protein n=1 Tax=Sinorhizobium sojae CCBAU 05684 TaxID=716928 RepID=A0A249P8W7_9HYPH|nr:hypothetical protein [Sinorhizobium sojae]ASY62182.1 conserved hypothetical signal peptide protein [Sinorhizobium sojae CCBAU 05684]